MRESRNLPQQEPDKRFLSEYDGYLTKSIAESDLTPEKRNRLLIRMTNCKTRDQLDRIAKKLLVPPMEWK
jgi:hypothetical protein